MINPAKRVSRWALYSLFFALSLAIVGYLLKRHGYAPFWSGLLLAFGEAALVGGLADWFAIRALFAHPFGIPFPHTAIIPNNRKRLVAQIRDLVQNHWLSRDYLHEKISEFDFVEGALMPLVGAEQSHLQKPLRDVARQLAHGLSADAISTYLASVAGRVIEAKEVAPFLAEAAKRAHQQGWLEPFLKMGMGRLQDWAESMECRHTIRRHLEQAAEQYKSRGWFKNFTFEMAEAVGGIDLDTATTVLQQQIHRFAQAQMEPESSLGQQIKQTLSNIESRLNHDPSFIEGLQKFLSDSSEQGTVQGMIAAIVHSLKDEGIRRLDSDDSRLIAWCLERVNLWLSNVREDDEQRAWINQGCHNLASMVIDRHHELIGALVEEQLNRLTDEDLTELIETKVGEDLHWIRLNGTFVGGLIGAVLYLFFSLL